MKSHRFRPIGIDALEDRMVMTSFSTPFALITQLVSEVNPKFVILTGRTESQISSSISAGFNRFDHTFTTGLAQYQTAIARPNADITAINAKFEAKVAAALGRLNQDLLAVSHKLPFGGVNLYPTLQDRITGANGVKNFADNTVAPSLQTRLQDSFAAGDVTAAQEAIRSTQTFVRADVKNYINLGVTNGYFKLGRGAFLPQLS